MIVANTFWVKSSSNDSCMSCHAHPESDASWKQSYHHNNGSGTKTDCAAITFRSVSRLTIRQSPEVDWTLDGERAEGREEICIENLHRAIRLVHRQEEP